MPRRKTTVAPEATVETVSDPFAHIRTDMVEAVGGICDSCGNFADKNLKIAPLAREIGVPPVTLSDYLRGNKDVGRKTLARFINFLNSRKSDVTDEQAEALAEAATL